MFPCKKCHKVFSTLNALNGHQQVHLPKEECKFGCGKKSTTASMSRHQKSCYLNPNNIRYCQNPDCGKLIKRNETIDLKNPKKQKKFCSSSCSAVVANTGREVTSEQRERTRKSINTFFDNDPFYRNIENKKDFVKYRKSVERRSIQQLIIHNPSEYNRLMSNKYRGYPDSLEKLVIDHKEQVHTCWAKRKSVEYASDIRNLQVISHKENLKRQTGYSPKKIWEKYRKDEYIHGNSKRKQINHDFW